MMLSSSRPQELRASCQVHGLHLSTPPLIDHICPIAQREKRYRKEIWPWELHLTGRGDMTPFNCQYDLGELANNHSTIYEEPDVRSPDTEWRFVRKALRQLLGIARFAEADVCETYRAPRNNRRETRKREKPCEYSVIITKLWQDRKKPDNKCNQKSKLWSTFAVNVGENLRRLMLHR
jgi:hypothetical protein